MIDFVTGLLIAIKETFKAKKTINYPFEKGSLGTRSRGCLLYTSDAADE